MTESIYWYDFETTGIDPVLDRPIQFGGVRTDLDLHILDEPLNLIGRPGDDVLPSPEAISVTGILMSRVQEEGLIEARFCQRIIEEFSRPQTCVAGFNSIRFDDEFTRQMLYRNFYEPYAREWQGGNSRWDVIDLFRMARALRPEGLNWPVDDRGVPSFRLERLTDANGIGHDEAHDAVSDVLATIELTRLLRTRQPKLYDYLFALRDKKAVLRQLYPLGKAPVVHVSSMYPASRGCLALVLPLCVHPTNRNGIICYDLSVAPDPLIEATPSELERLVFSKTADLAGDEQRIPLKTIHINRCPAVSPPSTLTGENARRLGIDMRLCEEHGRRLQQAGGIVEKITEAFRSRVFEENPDPDFMLYQGEFFTADDVAVMQELRQASPESLSAFRGRFQDPRLDEMLFRYRARNYPESLDERESQHWRQFKREKWHDGEDIRQAIDRTREMLSERGDEPCLVDLLAYLESLLRDLGVTSETN